MLLEVRVEQPHRAKARLLRVSHHVDAQLLKRLQHVGQLGSGAVRLQELECRGEREALHKRPPAQLVHLHRSARRCARRERFARATRAVQRRSDRCRVTECLVGLGLTRVRLGTRYGGGAVRFRRTRRLRRARPARRLPLCPRAAASGACCCCWWW